MKTYKGKCNSYSIKELSNEAFDNAYNNWYRNIRYPYDNMVKRVFKQFCGIFDVNIIDFDIYDGNFRFTITNNDFNNDDLTGIRLAKYLWNNYADYINEYKYYSNIKMVNGKRVHKSRSRHSRTTTTMLAYPLTGYYLDNYILKPIINCLTYKELFDSYEELINDCFNEFFYTLQQDMESQTTEEYFINESEANVYRYDIDGNIT